MYVHSDTGHRDPMAARTQCNGTGILGLYEIHVCMELKEIGSLTVTKTKIRGQHQHREFDLYVHQQHCSLYCTLYTVGLVCRSVGKRYLLPLKPHYARSAGPGYSTTHCPH
jgi:hypothetical protein